MAYTYTEKKRIRKNFGKRNQVIDIPSMLDIQTDSYASFLNTSSNNEDRENSGIHKAFKSVFPIISHSGHVRLEYADYTVGKPLFNVHECQLRGLTYAAPLKVLMKLVICERENLDKVKEVLEENSVHYDELGIVDSDKLTFKDELNISIQDLNNKYKSWLKNYMVN